MYIPSFNRVDDTARIDDFIDRYGFATVVTTKDGELLASHLPVLLDKSKDGARILRSHMARANRQWQHFTPEAEVLCIFSGPHSYISPSWYEMQHTVPTWNYSAVHVYGRAVITEDFASLRKIVFDTTAKYEVTMSKPWQIPLSDEEVATMLKAVVGFSVAVTRMEGKFKLGQNRSVQDQKGMLRGLLHSSEAMSQELGKFIAGQGGLTREGSARAWP